MIKLLFVKRFALLLLLIYGCRLGQPSSVTTYFIGKVCVNSAPVRYAAEGVLKCCYADNDHPLSFHFLHFSCLQVFDVTRPKSLTNNKVRAFLRKNCPLLC